MGMAVLSGNGCERAVGWPDLHDDRTGLGIERKSMVRG